MKSDKGVEDNLQFKANERISEYIHHVSIDRMFFNQLLYSNIRYALIESHLKSGGTTGTPPIKKYYERNQYNLKKELVAPLQVKYLDITIVLFIIA